MDAQDIPGLAAMLTSLELCSAVVELAPTQVAAQLMDLVHQGFLVPVLGPALVQEQDAAALVASTAYLDLFLKHITATALRAAVVRFLLCEQVIYKQLPSSNCLILLGGGASCDRHPCVPNFLV